MDLKDKSHYTVYNFKVTEVSIGIADRTKGITVQAPTYKKALKYLQNYLESCYEDSLTLLTPTKANPNQFSFSMRRVAGHLRVERIADK